MAAGELIDYEELQMAIRGCGRPSQKLSAGEEKRFMSFYEKLHKLRDMKAEAVREVVSGRAGKNPGGAGTVKRCSVCGSTEHRSYLSNPCTLPPSPSFVPPSSRKTNVPSSPRKKGDGPSSGGKDMKKNTKEECADDSKAFQERLCIKL